MFFLIEFLLTVIAVAAGFAFPNLGASWFEKVELLLGRLARRRGRAVLVVGFTALALRAAVLPVLPIPEPSVHDEFSYLLAADTFAHGRLANPTHPMWVHFETFHINSKPTYVAMVHPAQGLFLAAGQVIFGHPFWGLWLSVGVMCAAICWMLQGWLPPIWALLGGLLAVIRLGAFSYWANSYWGGAVAATGGALVLGALPRIKRQQRVRDALLMGIGLAILGNSRPYEGLFFSLPVGIALLVWMMGKKSPPLRISARRIIVPLAVVLLATFAAMTYYFWRTTGSPLQSPYLLNVQIYSPVPFFPWLPLKPVPEYRHAVMKTFYVDWCLSQYEFARLHPVSLAVSKAISACLFFLGPILGLPFFMLAIVLPYGMSYAEIGHETRFLLLVCCLSVLGLLLPIYIFPHYAAPLTAAIYALVLLAMQRVRHWQWRGRPTGLAIVRAVPLICVALLLLRVSLPFLPMASVQSFGWCAQGIQMLDRAHVLTKVKQSPGRHLVIIRYQPNHDPHQEWVYNQADIDSAKVVWARDMGSAQNEELIRYFSDRHVWLAEPDEIPPKLSPYFGQVATE